MQKQEMAEKKRAMWDGEEIPGLVSVEEITLTKNTVEVPSFKRIRPISAGIKKIPAIKLKYRVDRPTKTQKFLEEFFEKEQVKDLTIIKTDAHGVEYSRRLCPLCECVEITDPAYSAESPQYASMTITVYPDDIIPLGAA